MPEPSGNQPNACSRAWEGHQLEGTSVGWEEGHKTDTRNLGKGPARSQQGTMTVAAHGTNSSLHSLYCRFTKLSGADCKDQSLGKVDFSKRVSTPCPATLRWLKFHPSFSRGRRHMGLEIQQRFLTDRLSNTTNLRSYTKVMAVDGWPPHCPKASSKITLKYFLPQLVTQHE